MITSLEIENFKAFGAKAQTIRIAPITLLFGANSVGKSSFFQALFYLREVLETGRASTDTVSHFATNLDFGGFGHLVHAHDQERGIRFALTIATEEHDEESEYSFAHSLLTVEIEIVNSLDDRAFVKRFQLNIDGEKLVGLTATWNSRKKWMDIDIDFGFQTKAFGTFFGKWQNQDGKWTTIYRFPGAIPMERDPILSKCTQKNGVRVSGEDQGFVEEVDEFMIEALRLIKESLNDSLFIGPIRAVPSPDFNAVGAPAKARWSQGIAAWDLLHFSSFDEIEELNSSLESLGLGICVEKQRFLPVIKSVRDRIPPEEVHRLRLRPYSENRENVAISPQLRVQDVGFGVSQVIPVVVAIRLARERYVLVEQPEIHLHPRLQTRLGDVLIKGCISTAGKKCAIIETHSEHLLLRILRRIRETTNGGLPANLPEIHVSDVAINYFKPGKNGTVVKQLRVNEEGEFIDSWPDGFFDERIEEMFG